MRPTAEPPRDFIDRLMRGLLGKVDNLADFLRCARPRLATGFVFERGRPVNREFVTEDWRRREADLLFEVPYRWAERQSEVLVQVLLEHQSDTDPVAPLRLLFESVMAWAQQWQQWAAQPPPRGSLRLQPVLPVVLYTANLPWGSNETLHDLMDAPTELTEQVPNWGPIFWNLSERTTEELLGAGPFLQILAVMRAREAETETFQGVYRQASANLAPLAAQQMVRWQELIRGLLGFGLWERPQVEHSSLVTAVRETNQPKEPEVIAMAQTMAESLLEQGETRGELKTARRFLRDLLDNKFGPLPETVLQQIQASQDVEKLRRAALAILKMESLDEFSL